MAALTFNHQPPYDDLWPYNLGIDVMVVLLEWFIALIEYDIKSDTWVSTKCSDYQGTNE